MTPSVLLVHSPLLGPSSWAAVAAIATDRGRETALPDLTGVADARPPMWEVLVAMAAAAGASLAPPIVVTGHSGAGAFLPEIGRRLGDRVGALVFVDAVVPPRSGSHRTSPALTQMLDGQTTGGALAPWLDWWPADLVEALLPDAADRAALAADMPTLPRAFYDEAVPTPDGWADGPCAYLRLSAAYDAELAEAAARGWARSAIDANHLSVLTEPDRVLDALEALLDRLPAPPPAPSR